MKQIIETSDYVEAIKSFTNGCAFNAYIEKEDIKIGFGCYCLVNLKTGVRKVFVNAIEQNKSEPVSIKVFHNEDKLELIKLEILKQDPFCKYCNGTIKIKESK